MVFLHLRSEFKAGASASLLPHKFYSPSILDGLGAQSAR